MGILSVRVKATGETMEIKAERFNPELHEQTDNLTSLNVQSQAAVPEVKEDAPKPKRRGRPPKAVSVEPKTE